MTDQRSSSGSAVVVTIYAHGDNENTPAEAVHHALAYAHKAGFIESWSEPHDAAQTSSVTEDMVERAWAAIVGSDVAPICFQASIIRADLRSALEAVHGVAQASLEWAVSRWNAEVANRPLKNVHRRSLDTTWRQVIRQFGGDDVALCGPPHDALVCDLPSAAQASSNDIGLSLAQRLRDAAQSAQNDDLSKPQTEKRERHIIRVEAILDAAEYLEEAAAPHPAGHAYAPLQRALEIHERELTETFLSLGLRSKVRTVEVVFAKLREAASLPSTDHAAKK